MATQLTGFMLPFTMFSRKLNLMYFLYNPEHHLYLDITSVGNVKMFTCMPYEICSSVKWNRIMFMCPMKSNSHIEMVSSRMVEENEYPEITINLQHMN